MNSARRRVKRIQRQGPADGVAEAVMSLRETGLVAATGCPRHIEMVQLRDDYGFAPVREHFETFRAEAAHLRDGEGLPRFVEEEFEVYLRWGGGVLACPSDVHPV